MGLLRSLVAMVGTGNDEAGLSEEVEEGDVRADGGVGNRRVQVAGPAMPSGFKPAAC